MKRANTTKPGFTLVELLVVIGIIALLISILLPALNLAKKAANQTACASKLHSIMIGATLHASEHREYYPLCGALTGATGPTLGDNYSQYYDYRDTSDTRYSSWGIPLPSPSITSINMALAAEMGFKFVMYDTYDQWSVDRNDPNGFSKLFICPADNLSQPRLTDARGPTSPMIIAVPTSSVEWITTAISSYVFNEYVLGYNDTYGRLRGKISRIHRPASTFFAADGLPGPFSNRITGDFNFPIGSCTLYNNFPNLSINPQLASISMGDILAGTNYRGLPVASSPASFDKVRHNKKINVAFCDGHVESLNCDAAGLSQAYLQAP